MSKTGEKIKAGASNRQWWDFLVRHGLAYDQDPSNKHGYKGCVRRAIEWEYEKIVDQHKQDRADSYVYIVGSLEMGFVKIGKARNPIKRLD